MLGNKMNIERYRELYQYEVDCNQKMLKMIESVPAENRGDPRYQRACCIAAHLAACRENWLCHMAGTGSPTTDWFVESCDPSTLPHRYASLETGWTNWLADIDDESLEKDFSFKDGGSVWNVKTRVQVEQLVGHACYHRGQIVLLIDMLGGETVDTDYVNWAWS